MFQQSERDKQVYHHIWTSVPDSKPSDTALTMLSRLRAQAEAASIPLSRVRVADLASGSGRHAREATVQGFDVTSVEYDSTAVARQRASGVPGVQQADVRAWIGRQSRSWDGMVLFDALHHMDSTVEGCEEILAGVRRLVVPGGYVLVTLLCDIKYSSGVLPQDRLDLPADQGEALLRRVFRQDEVVTVKHKRTDVPRTLTYDEQGTLVESDYSARRVLVLARIEDATCAVSTDHKRQAFLEDPS